jgi:hypothetical protein
VDAKQRVGMMFGIRRSGRTGTPCYGDVNETTKIEVGTRIFLGIFMIYNNLKI